MIPAAKLDRLTDRFSQIEAELASGIGGTGFAKLSKEHAELAPVIEAVNAYRSAARQLAGAEIILNDSSSDSEMRSLAEEERGALKNRLVRLEHELQI